MVARSLIGGEAGIARLWLAGTRVSVTSGGESPGLVVWAALAGYTVTSGSEPQMSHCLLPGSGVAEFAIS